MCVIILLLPYAWLLGGLVKILLFLCFYPLTDNSELSTIRLIFENAELSVAATWHGIMQFSLVNRLSYSAMSNLLHLLAFILPSTNQLPKSVHLLKEEYCCSIPVEQKFCAGCLAEVGDKDSCCQKPLCKKKHADVCRFVNVPFDDHLKHICQSKLYNKLLVIKLHMRKNYILLAGLWYGPVKTSMEAFLRPVLEEIDRLIVVKLLPTNSNIDY